MQVTSEEYWLERRLEDVTRVKLELRRVLEEGHIKDKRLRKLLLETLAIVHSYEVELEDRLDELWQQAKGNK
jgi:ADP-dependent phosphofructokinase/glucokinase